MHDVRDRRGDERRRVVHHVPRDARREVALEHVHLVLDGLADVERIRARQQEYAQAAGWLAVIPGSRAVALRTEVDPRDVAQTYHAAVVARTQDDVVKLLDRREQCVAGDRCGENLALDGRIRAERTGRELGILRLDCVQYLRRRHTVALQLVRIEPDAHCVLGTEHERVADAVDATDHRLDLRCDDVGQARGVDGRVGRFQSNEHQDIGTRFRDHDAFLGDLGGQQRLCERDLVLHLHFRDVWVRSGGEAQRDRRRAVRVRDRIEVQQIVDAGELLLDHLRDGRFHRGRIGAGIGRGDRDLRGCDVRIRVDPEACERDRTEQADQDRDHPREHGPVDKETWHAVTPTTCFRQADWMMGGRHRPATVSCPRWGRPRASPRQAALHGPPACPTRSRDRQATVPL